MMRVEDLCKTISSAGEEILARAAKKAEGMITSAGNPATLKGRL